ncbi:MAG: hypothetical protein GXP27_09825 [Planctomycetes bacterium]|nr:hypothetical protein [Planctomycetota bacterium]
MLQSETTELLAKNQFAEAAKRIEEHGKTNRRDHPWVMRWVLQLTCRLVKEDKAPQAFQFVSSLENPLWREAAFQIAAALCVRRGLAGYAWQFAQESRLSATEEVALLHGLVVALAEKRE